MTTLTKMATSVIAATGIIAATIAPASAADNGPGFAAVSYSKNGYCHLVVAPGSRAKAQLDKLQAIYIKEFTDANTEMRRRVAADLGLTMEQISQRQYSDADAQKIGMTKAQLQALHDRLNRKAAAEFIIPGGLSFFGIHDWQATTAEQVKYLKKDREEKLGRGVYWVTNDAGRVDYVPPQPVKDYFAKRLADVYAPVLANKQRGAEFSNVAVKKCVDSRHTGKVLPLAIGLVDEIHRHPHNENWVNPPLLTQREHKNVTITPIDEPTNGNHSAPRSTPSTPKKDTSTRTPEEKRRDKVEAERWQLKADQYYRDQTNKLWESMDADRMRIGEAEVQRKYEEMIKDHKRRGIVTPVSLHGDDYMADTTAHTTVAADGTVVYDDTTTPGSGTTTGDDSPSGSDSGSSGLFGSS